MTSSVAAESVREAVAEELARWRTAPGFWVACSAGGDSVALAHAVVDRLRESSPGAGSASHEGQWPAVRLVHIDHGLQDRSKDWAEAVRALGRRLEIAVRVIAVDVGPSTGQGPEAAARRARYHALAEVVSSNEVLLMAHHMDDQAETVLLNLLRGSGPEGLAAMPVRRRFGRGWLVRPVLPLPKEALMAYCNVHGLGWHEDPSNADRSLRRNHLRHTVMPALEHHWPAARRSLARAAALQGEAAQELAQLADHDLEAMYDHQTGTVALAPLLALEHRRAARVLRAWFARRGLGSPSRSSLRELLTVARTARADRQFEHRWPGVVVRRYRDTLFAEGSPEDESAGRGALSGRGSESALPRSLRWQIPAYIEFAGGRLWAESAPGAGLSQAKVLAAEVEVRARRGGERLRPQGRGLEKRVKSLFQEIGLAPWRRADVPLVYVDGALAAVADLWLDERFAAAPEEPGWQVRWEAPW